jgi:predicted RNA-binding Zn-ribbon protein involved in translation (DUF1610 family)
MASIPEEFSRDVVLKERYKLCPSCSYFVHMSEKDVFCILCGEKLIEECLRCREPILYPLTKFCPVCGDQLTKLQRSNQHNPSQLPPSPQGGAS